MAAVVEEEEGSAEPPEEQPVVHQSDSESLSLSLGRNQRLQQQRPQEEQKNDLGIDQDFLANLPEDIRQEILADSRVRNHNLGR